MDHDNIPGYVRELLGRFQGVRPTRDGWDALCPCPDHNRDGDQNASLRIALGEDGRILLKCRVGCVTDAVLEAAGLDWDDLFARDCQAACPEGGAAAPEAPPSRRPEKADAGLCDRAYRLLLEQLPLDDLHRQDLHRRGLTDKEIDRRRYGSLRNVDRGRAARVVHEQLGDDVLGVPGFVRGDYGITLLGESAGLLVPVRDLRGRIRALKIRRAAEPKYVYLTGDADGPGCGSPVHVPLGVAARAEVIRITEGELKADVAFALDGTPTVGVPGVTQWKPALPLLKELGAQTVVVAYDAPDVRTKLPVLEQAELLYQELTDTGLNVEMEVWDDE
jgi:hypothetical protein